MTIRVTGFLLALLALSTGPVWAGPIASDVSLVCAQTPSDAAFDAANPQITPDDPNPGTANCPSLCGKWVKGCQGLVAKMKACWLGAAGKVAGLRNAVCATLDEPGKSSCKDIVENEKDGVKDFISTNVEAATGFCQGIGLANCITNCS